MQKMWAIPEVTFDFYKNAVLPKVHETAFRVACDKLRDEGDLTDDGWSSMRFEENNGKNENDFYASLAKYLQKVVDANGLIRFSSEPESNLESERDHGSFQADINGLVTRTTVAVDADNDEECLCGVVMTGEFNKYNEVKDIDDNVKKVVSNANKILGADPTRRFMFGLTVERYDTRFWYFSRSHVFVTEKVDLHKNFREIIHFALALGFATAVELGYDPTVRRVAGSRYVFTIQDKQYITVAVMSVQKAKYLLGSAPRIYRVQRVIDLAKEEFDSEVKVLKDFWIPEDAHTDLEIREYIRSNLQVVNFVPGLKTEDFDDYFVVIEACEKIQVPSAQDPVVLVDDNSSNFLRGHTLPQNFNLFHLSSQSSPQSSSQQSQLTESAGTERNHYQVTTNEIVKLTTRSHYKNKVHCRTLLEYAGETLEETTEWSTVLMALSKSVTALSYMHSAGVVHRDVSTGNILIQGNKAKINDLEYAKIVESRSAPISHSDTDVNIGTLFFMAIEVVRHKYAFRPIPDLDTVFSLPRIPFRYNYLHDLESLYWILIFILITKWPQSLPPSPDQHRKHKETFAHIFLCGVERRRQFLLCEDPVDLKKAVEATVDEFRKGWIQIFGWGQLLTAQHKEVESKWPEIGSGFFTDLYSEIRSRVNVIDQAVQWKGNLVYAQAPKRQLADESREESSDGKKPKVGE